MKKIKTIIVLLSFSMIGCVTSGKYKELQQSCEDNEKKLQEELNLEKNKTAKLEDEFKNEIKQRQEKYNEVLREKISLRSSMSQMEGTVDELNQDKSELSREKQEMEKALEELRIRKEESEARIAEFKSLLGKFKAFIDTGKLKIKIIDGRMVIVLPSDVLFASGSKVLSTNGRKAVSEVTEILAKIENRKFQIEGHTDSDKMLTRGQTNWNLAADRALNVLKTMIKAGMPSDKISAASFGDIRPIVPNTSKANKAQNRRIEIVVVPDLSLLPGYEDLKEMAKDF